jgi:CRP/FNR family transcriptional regulator, cyclic AMP receptor protein
MAHPLFATLNDADRRMVTASMRRRKFMKSEHVFHEGDPGNAVHFIVKGRFAVRVSTPMGEVATLAVLGSDDSFGELALLDPKAIRTAGIVAIDSAETLSLHTDEFETLRREHPGITDVLVQLLAGQVRRLSTQLLDALYVPADQRVLRRVLDMADVFRSAAGSVVIELTQDDIATMAGTTRPTVNQVLKQHEATGTIRLSRGRIEVLNESALRKKAGLR